MSSIAYIVYTYSKYSMYMLYLNYITHYRNIYTCIASAHSVGDRYHYSSSDNDCSYSLTASGAANKLSAGSQLLLLLS